MIAQNTKCRQCNDRPIQHKKRRLCKTCYNRLRSRLADGSYTFMPQLVPPEIRELDFVQAYFDHNDWIAQPAKFRLRRTHYTPDFYDARRNVFIEVSGTRQAYHAAKDKYALFRQIYPGLQLEVRKPDGTLLNESEDRLDWEQSNPDRAQSDGVVT